MLSVNISNIAITCIENVDYHCITHDVNKVEGMNLKRKFWCFKIVCLYKKYCQTFGLAQ